ncbi:phosphoribosyltransferase [Methylocapsa acidiphila]|uniref:phosphoribosyltransferase n=1 Tax=Methylocapsa acidiphila TaxID=133552 RepID=UPI000418674E|nr:phosphoribosyltransferase [Methylocapsa acidiphila]
MKLFFMCGYNSDAAHDAEARPPAYQDAYRFCRAVRSGRFEQPFLIHMKTDKVSITQRNIGLARRAFGKFIAKRIAEEGSWSNPLLVPIPSEDALIDAKEFRSWVMVSEALAPIDLKWSLVDALFWTAPPLSLDAHSVAPPMVCDFPVGGQAIVLLDDIVSSSASLFAARDCLRAEGAVVLGAIACGRLVHDFSGEAFGRQEIWLDEAPGVDN